MEAPTNEVKRINGGTLSQVVVGAGANVIAARNRGYAVVIRVEGTIIAAMLTQCRDQAAPIANAPTWLGIALHAGEYYTCTSPLQSITLTGAADSVIVYADNSY